MSEKYNRIMENIAVTEEMRRRVLQGMQNAESPASPKIIPFPHWKRYLSAAAGFVLLFACVFLGFRLFDHTQPPPVQMSGSISECTDVNALAHAVGFPMSDLTTLPFEPAAINYTSFWGQMGQIVYSGADGQRAVYRKSAGNEDNSGDYNEYANTAEITVDSVTVTLKGDGGQYSLAWWSDGEYSYSLSLSPGIELSAWSPIITGIQ